MGFFHFFRSPSSLSLDELTAEALKKKVTELEEQNAALQKEMKVEKLKDVNYEDSQKSILDLLEQEKKLEADLKAERDRAQAIIQSMGEGLLSFDKDFRLTIINSAAEKLLDISNSEAIGKHWSEIVTTLKDDQPIQEEDLTFNKTIKTGKVIVTSIEDNHYYRTQKGKIFPVSSVTAPLRNGEEIIGVVKVFRDVSAEKEQNIIIERTVQERTQEITEKNEALQKARDEISQGWFELQAEKARLTASIASISLGFILTDTNEHIVMINPASARILELHEEAKQFSQIESILKNSCDLHMLHLECESERRTIEVQDVIFGNKYLRIFLAPILSSAKGAEELIGTVILLEDTTEAKVMDRSKDEFFSIASHELRTPLTSIRGNTSMILDYYKDQLQDQDLVEMLKDINASSIRLIGIVNDFLNVSRLEQKKMEFKKEAFDLIFTINQVFQELQGMVVPGVELKVENGVGIETPKALADPDKTKEVLINLIGNALKFTEKGEVVVSIFAENSHLKVFVRDTGRGITPQYQSLLFRKFQQAGESLFTRDTTKGTGLGLYISKLMVEGMGGQIWLERSESGRGSVFGFTLPSGN